MAGYERAIHERLASGAAMDPGMLYFDARLSSHYPTVEIRVPDVCTDIADALLIAALARGLVDTPRRSGGPASRRPGSAWGCCGRRAGGLRVSGWVRNWSTSGPSRRSRHSGCWTSWSFTSVMR